MADSDRRDWDDRIAFYREFGCDIAAEREFFVEKSRPLTGDILEIGTGRGYLTAALAREDLNIITVDNSRVSQERAKEAIKNLGLEERVDFRLESAENLPFGDGRFDMIVSANTLHHLDRPLAALRELSRVIKSGGKIVLSDFTKEGFDLVARIHQAMGQRHTAGRFTIKDAFQYLRSRGFSLRSYRGRYQELIVARRGR